MESRNSRDLNFRLLAFHPTDPLHPFQKPSLISLFKQLEIDIMLERRILSNSEHSIAKLDMQKNKEFEKFVSYCAQRATAARSCALSPRAAGTIWQTSALLLQAYSRTAARIGSRIRSPA